MGEARELVQVVFGVVLHGPERAAPVGHRYCLNRREGVSREIQRAAREMGDLVLVRDERVEHPGLSDEQGMPAAIVGQDDLARDPHLPPAGVRSAAAACRDHRDLRGPAASEARNSRFERGAREFDLRPYRRIVVLVDSKAGTRPGDSVVRGEGGPPGQRVAGVRRTEDVDRCLPMAGEQHALVELACGGGAGGGEALPPVPPVPVDHEKMQSRHRIATRGFRRDAPLRPADPRPARTPRPRCCRPGPDPASR